MKNYFKYDFINKAIVGSKAAIKRANSGNGNEYLELCKMLAEHPDFRVVPKEIEVNATKKKYNGLTFNRMKEYGNKNYCWFNYARAFCYTYDAKFFKKARNFL